MVRRRRVAESLVSGIVPGSGTINATGTRTTTQGTPPPSPTRPHHQRRATAQAAHLSAQALRHEVARWAGAARASGVPGEAPETPAGPGPANMSGRNEDSS